MNLVPLYIHNPEAHNPHEQAGCWRGPSFHKNIISHNFKCSTECRSHYFTMTHSFTFKVKQWWMWITWFCHCVRLCTIRGGTSGINMTNRFWLPVIESANRINDCILSGSLLVISSYCLIRNSHDVLFGGSCQTSHGPRDKKHLVSFQWGQVWGDLVSLCYFFEGVKALLFWAQKWCVATLHILHTLNWQACLCSSSLVFVVIILNQR